MLKQDIMELFSSCKVNVITVSGEDILTHRKGKVGRNKGGKEVNLTDLSMEQIWSSKDLINICKMKTNEKSEASHFGFIMYNHPLSDYVIESHSRILMPQ